MQKHTVMNANASILMFVSQVDAIRCKATPKQGCPCERNVNASRPHTHAPARVPAYTPAGEREI
ncbi:MAG: hypothetical protein IKX36_12140 [Prevotella sp.]|nr:hypothetical protein [Prevotella sp.]